MWRATESASQPSPFLPFPPFLFALFSSLFFSEIYSGRVRESRPDDRNVRNHLAIKAAYLSVTVQQAALRGDLAWLRFQLPGNALLRRAGNGSHHLGTFFSHNLTQFPRKRNHSCFLSPSSVTQPIMMRYAVALLCLFCCATTANGTYV